MTPAAPFPSRWKVADPILIADTFSSLIWKVHLDDGTLAVIKDLKPVEDIEDELRGAHLLEWQDWVAPVLAEPLTVVGGVAQPSTVPGSGVSWNEAVIARCLV